MVVSEPRKYEHFVGSGLANLLVLEIDFLKKKKKIGHLHC